MRFGPGFDLVQTSHVAGTEPVCYPQMILFGPDGKMAIRRIGWNEKSSKDVRAAIEAQLAKMPAVKPGSKASSRPATQKTKQG